VTRAVRLATILLLLMPATHQAAIRLVERNGDVITGRDLVSLRITGNGFVVVVPDQIFVGRFER
jgi:hypothetical protein